MTDEQDQAEALDGDEIDPVDFPPERPTGVEDLLREDVPVAGGYAPDDLATRMAREEPDVLAPSDEDVVLTGITDPDDPLGPDETKELIGERGEGDWDVIDPGGALSEAPAAGHRADALPAEEAALHVVDEPG